MENKRIAVAAIVIDEQSAAVEVNNVLHDYSDIIIGRMGLPIRREVFLSYRLHLTRSLTS